MERGEAVGIVGPSGSGKSTLIQVRLRHPDAGSFLVWGVDARQINDESWLDQIAFVPQDCRVYNGTIRENIQFFRPQATDAQIEEAARRAHVHDEIMAMPDGYETKLGSRGGALPGASGRGSRSPVRSCADQRSWCSTSRPAPSTCGRRNWSTRRSTSVLLQR